jgi:hypothetical protein
MLTNDTYVKYTIDVPNSKKKHLYLKDNDLLFWYFYVSKYGYDMYIELGNHKFVTEKDTKIQNITISKNNNAVLKQNKISICEYENNLLNDHKITLTTLKGLCLYNNIYMWIIIDDIYFIFGDQDETTIPILLYKKNKKFSMVTESTIEEINTIRSSLHEIVNHGKPLNGISSYKVAELVTLCNTLNIDIKLSTGKNKTKTLIHKDLMIYFSKIDII